MVRAVLYVLKFEANNIWCTIWDDVRTYLTSTIDPKEKAALLVAIAHFKKEVEQ
jgi:hypothetical protein